MSCNIAAASRTRMFALGARVSSLHEPNYSAAAHALASRRRFVSLVAVDLHSRFGKNKSRFSIGVMYSPPLTSRHFLLQPLRPHPRRGCCSCTDALHLLQLLLLSRLLELLLSGLILQLLHLYLLLPLLLYLLQLLLLYLLQLLLDYLL